MPYVNGELLPKLGICGEEGSECRGRFDDISNRNEVLMEAAQRSECQNINARYLLSGVIDILFMTVRLGQSKCYAMTGHVHPIFL